MSYTRAFLRVFALALLAGLVATPAWAQVDLSGIWTNVAHEDQQHRRSGPDMGDYTGLPLNDAARLRADSWDAGIVSVPDWQCRPHPADYITVGPSTLMITKEINPLTREVVAWHGEWLRGKDRPFYMDGRPHPPQEAPHTWGGFATAKWEGDMLTITTTHLKEGYYRRNGLARSDMATVTEHLIRHGDYLHWVTVIDDPVYLTEPFVRTTEYRLSLNGELDPNPCDVAQVAREVERPRGTIPHFLPGANPLLAEFAGKYPTLPAAAIRGYTETLYPDYQQNIRQSGAQGAPPGRPSVARSLPNRDPHGAVAAGEELRWLHVRGNVYLLAGAGANISALVGPEGVILVDAGAETASDRVVQKIMEVTGKRVSHIIDTTLHESHTGGSGRVAAAGGFVTGGTVTADAGQRAQVIGHENLLLRMTESLESPNPVPFDLWPSDTYYTEQKKLGRFYHGEPVQIVHLPNASTDGDSMVFFRDSDVISAGELYSTISYPYIDVEKGGSIQGVIEGLNDILDLAIADAWAEGGTMIVPGHGRISDSADVAFFRDMVTIVRDRVQDMIDRGMSLDQVISARPTLDYDPRYGADSGSWTTDMFVEAVYRSLTQNR